MSRHTDFYHEPEEGDYILSSNGYKTSLSIQGEKFLCYADSMSEAELVHFIRERMVKEQYWPNVWFISDHGNARLVRLYKHCYRFFK
jgi:hypothetical protein